MFAGIRYVVRAVGLVFSIGVSLVVFGAAIWGTKPSASVATVAAVAALGSVLSWPRFPDAWRLDPPTQRQLEYAAKLGIAVPAGTSKGALSDAISRATAH